VRLFVGVRLPDALRDDVAAHAASLREAAPDLKWVDPSLYHLTLQFLGDVKTAESTALGASLSELSAMTPFTLRLGETEAFPPGKQARVLAIALSEGFASLAALAKTVMSVTEHHGILPERRPYRAHLTLARVRRGMTMPASLTAGGQPSRPWPKWEVGAFHLYESVLRPGGPKYSSRLRVDLEGSEA
jgi:2'-5' RNA ligase